MPLLHVNLPMDYGRESMEKNRAELSGRLISRRLARWS